MIKFLDLIKFEKVFNNLYIVPRRKVRLGNDRMVMGILMLLFIGFNRLWHFTYIRLDDIMCGFFQLTRLPVASTFWRYVDSLGINQTHSFLKIMSVLRERVWQLCGLTYETIHLSTDTTVETLYGHQQGGRKGHNKKTVVKRAIALSFVSSMKRGSIFLETSAKEKPTYRQYLVLCQYFFYYLSFTN